MKKDKWVWMPHPGHFCGGSNCRFVMNTYVGKYIVSTVGEYRPEYSKEIEEIGLDRKYETMVFHAGKSEHKCCPYQVSNLTEIDMEGYNTSEAAFSGHYKLCKKWAAK